MGWIKVDGGKLSDEILGVQQDMLAIFLHVHDEADYLVDKILMKPIMTKVAEVSENKRFFNRFGLPFVNMYFDIEFDKWDSFTAKESFSPSKYEYDQIVSALGLGMNSPVSVAVPVSSLEGAGSVEQVVEEAKDSGLNLVEAIVIRMSGEDLNDGVAEYLNRVGSGEVYPVRVILDDKVIIRMNGMISVEDARWFDFDIELVSGD